MHSRSFLLLCAATRLALSLPVPAAAQELSFPPGLARLRFAGDPAVPQQVEACGDLQTWDLAAAPVFNAELGRWEMTEPFEPGTVRRFYRVRAGAALTVPRRLRELSPRYGYGSSASGEAGTNPFPEAVLAPVNNANFGAPWSPSASLNDAALAAARTTGLTAWRRIGTHGACASCHAPDAYDLARIAYTDADITRRALDHVTPAEAAQLVQFIKAQRQTHRMTRLLHPLNFRPLQPGHVPLAGATAEARDLAFGQQLVTDTGLLWARDRIESRAQALAAQAQLRALDLRKLRVGVEFDRWSEDAAHGSAHLSASEWIPGMGVQPAPGKAAEWYALQDAYLAEPTDARFYAAYDRIDALLVPIEPAGYERGQAWSLLKYKSVQLAQHLMRHESLGLPDALAGTTGGIVARRSTALARNPLFRTGDHVRRFPLQNDAANPSTTFPAFVQNTLPSSQTALRDMNENFFRVWFWMGWSHDPALLLSDSIFQTVEGDYLYSSLLARSKLHHAFVVAMTSVAKANAAAWFTASGDGVRGHGKWAAFNPFMALHHIERNRNEPPAGDARRALHDRMFSNTARLWIYLVQDDLERTASVYDRALVRGCIRFARAWLNNTEPALDHTALDAVIADIEQRLNTAQELRTDFTGQDLSGGLPF